MLFILCSTPQLHAQTTLAAHHYQQQIELDTPDCNTWKNHLQQALLNTMIRISGEVNLRRHPHFNHLRSHAERYIESYQCTEKLCANQTSYCHQLNINFNPKSIDNALKTMQLHAWQQPRPRTLLWIYDQQSQTLLQNHSILANKLQQHAQQRAIDIILPIGDLNDQQLEQDELATLAGINRIRKRYKTEQILMAIIPKTTGPLHCQLFLEDTLNQQQPPLTYSAANLEQLLDHLITHSPKNTLGKDQYDYNVLITGIAHIDQLGSLQKEFAKINKIQNISLLSIDKSTSIWQIKTTLPVQSLEAKLQQHGYLRRQDSCPAHTQALSCWQWQQPQGDLNATTVSTTTP